MSTHETVQAPTMSDGMKAAAKLFPPENAEAKALERQRAQKRLDFDSYQTVITEDDQRIFDRRREQIYEILRPEAWSEVFFVEEIVGYYWNLHHCQRAVNGLLDPKNGWPNKISDLFVKEENTLCKIDKMRYSLERSIKVAEAQIEKIRRARKLRELEEDEPENEHWREFMLPRTEPVPAPTHIPKSKEQGGKERDPGEISDGIKSPHLFLKIPKVLNPSESQANPPKASPFYTIQFDEEAGKNFLFAKDGDRPVKFELESAVESLIKRLEPEIEEIPEPERGINPDTGRPGPKRRIRAGSEYGPSYYEILTRLNRLPAHLDCSGDENQEVQSTEKKTKKKPEIKRRGGPILGMAPPKAKAS